MMDPSTQDLCQTVGSPWHPICLQQHSGLKFKRFEELTHRPRYGTHRHFHQYLCDLSSLSRKNWHQYSLTCQICHRCHPLLSWQNSFAREYWWVMSQICSPYKPLCHMDSLLSPGKHSWMTSAFGLLFYSSSLSLYFDSGSSSDSAFLSCQTWIHAWHSGPVE